jgi:hypothetical protein
MFVVCVAVIQTKISFANYKLNQFLIMSVLDFRALKKKTSKCVIYYHSMEVFGWGKTPVKYF